MKKILGLILLLVAFNSYGSGSTINPSTPVQGSALSSGPIRTNFAAAFNDVNGLMGQFNGSTAPSSPVLGQFWLNTTASPNILYEYDGIAWVPFLNFNTSTHLATSLMAMGSIQISMMGINFNATGDTPITITLPSGFTTYNLTSAIVIGSSGTFGTGKIGIYTAVSQGGQVLVNQTSPSLTVGTNTIGNGQSLSLAANVSGTALTLTTLYLNVGTAQGATSTGNVILSIRPLY